MLVADLAVHPDDAGVGLAAAESCGESAFGRTITLREAYTAIHASVASAGHGYVEVTRLTPERMA